MHEYAVVDELVAALVPRLADIPGRITAVFLRKGELRVLSDRALEHAFELLTRGTRLEGSRLEIETVRATVQCAGCSYDGPATSHATEGGHFSIPILACPRCAGAVTVRAGRELCVERVAVADEDRPEPPGAAR
jgi:hydrogenase nickel incorporation protein HypA/HybF